MSIHVDIQDPHICRRIESLVDLLGLDLFGGEDAASAPPTVVVTDGDGQNWVDVAPVIRVGVDVTLPGEEELLGQLLNGATQPHHRGALVVTAGPDSVGSGRLAAVLRERIDRLICVNLTDDLNWFEIPVRGDNPASIVDWNEVDLGAPTALSHLPPGSVSVVASRDSIPAVPTDPKLWRWVQQLRQRRSVLVHAGGVNPAQCRALATALRGDGQLAYVATRTAPVELVRMQLIRLADGGVEDLHILTARTAALRLQLGDVLKLSAGETCRFHYYSSGRKLVAKLAQYLEREAAQ